MSPGTCGGLSQHIGEEKHTLKGEYGCKTGQIGRGTPRQVKYLKILYFYLVDWLLQVGGHVHTPMLLILKTS